MGSKGEEHDFRNFDWDDTALIRAYEKAMKLKKDLEKGKLPKKNVSKENSKSQEWMAGDFCKAPYVADGLYYEAKIKSITEEGCTVEFIGYKEYAVVEVESLEPSAGKKARKKQFRKAQEAHKYSVPTESYDEGTDVSMSQSSDMSKRKMNKSCPTSRKAFECSAVDTTMNSAPFHHNCPPQIPTFSFPPAPPMPQCPTVAANPSLSAMLVSWYMAGYYTGVHQGKGQQCSTQHCCSHSNPCCHH